MSDQDFKDQILSAMADIKRSNEQAIAEVKQSVAEVKRSIEDIKHDAKRIDNGLRNVETDVAWIKGKLEGQQQSISNKDVKSAIWIALGSAVAAIISLIKSFW
ncbi:MAG: hypothetical protein OXH00_19640 [Candidatus Poribacteria bacterium]|nr:hypothetical protein [Candidatus Poribacteria bacterium]